MAQPGQGLPRDDPAAFSFRSASSNPRQPLFNVPAVTFCRPSRAPFTAPWRRWRSGADFPLLPRRASVFVERARFRRRAAALAASQHFQHPHAAMNHQGDYVARTHSPAGFVHPCAIHADLAGCDQPRGESPGLGDARMPKPFVEALALPGGAFRRSV